MDWSYIFSVTLQSAFGVEAIVFGLAAIGLNIQFGYTGLLNFGQSAFLAVAAYSLAVLVSEMGFSFWIGIIVGILSAIVLALLLGIPTLRLRADYLAIVTIAAAEIVRLLLRSVTFKDVFGGSDGINDFSNGFYSLNPIAARQFDFGPVSLSQDEVFVLESQQVNLYESVPQIEAFRETYSNQLSLFVRVFEYYGIIANRLPKAISLITGTGMIPGAYGV